MGDNKRKRGRKPKNPSPETLETTTTAAITTIAAEPSPSNNDDDFSIGNVELIDNNTASSQLVRSRGRGRPKKLPTVPDKNPAGRRVTRGVDSNGAVPTVPVEVGGAITMDADPIWESVSARVMPSMDSVVKVFCVHTEPNFSLPWQRKRQYSSSSSGFVISGKRVLTNAHSVEHYTQVKLKKRGSDTKYLATVLAIGTECDIGN
ncbi:hypothetical protein TSUD_186530 [Trifolium subterraneum]|uniref:Peptidase S1 domain-containing protein n=1 Tax=Trifolium subterraneum TaxID=3900 RepID=A0A2Z6NQR9_TRISU|nr:hypothetical protein TSUD_186530 [Trifolium subterraneum]